ncbi:hypothetical protein ACOMHN_014523 [Nucella lapillus]
MADLYPQWDDRTQCRERFFCLFPPICFATNTTDTMKNLAVFLFLVVMVGISSAYWIDGLYGNQFYDDEEAARMFSEHKRRDLSNSRDLCIPWRAPCPSDAQLSKQYSFLRCCGGLACKCTFWGNNCKCESRLGR